MKTPDAFAEWFEDYKAKQKLDPSLNHQSAEALFLRTSWDAALRLAEARMRAAYAHFGFRALTISENNEGLNPIECAKRAFDATIIKVFTEIRDK